MWYKLIEKIQFLFPLPYSFLTLPSGFCQSSNQRLMWEAWGFPGFFFLSHMPHLPSFGPKACVAPWGGILVGSYLKEGTWSFVVQNTLGQVRELKGVHIAPKCITTLFKIMSVQAAARNLSLTRLGNIANAVCWGARGSEDPHTFLRSHTVVGPWRREIWKCLTGSEMCLSLDLATPFLTLWPIKTLAQEWNDLYKRLYSCVVLRYSTTSELGSLSITGNTY